MVCSRDRPAFGSDPPSESRRGAVLRLRGQLRRSCGFSAGSSKWMISKARETMQDPTFWELPENVGQYRDDRRNVFLDGKSNLVIKAFKDGDTYYGGKINTRWEGGIGYTWEARIKFDCLTPARGPPSGCPVTPTVRSTSSSGTATASGRREPPCTPWPTVPNSRPRTSRWTAHGTPGASSGTTRA